MDACGGVGAMSETFQFQEARRGIVLYIWKLNSASHPKERDVQRIDKETGSSAHQNAGATTV